MYAFDIAYGIDLPRAQEAVGGEFASPVASEPTPRRGVAPPRPLCVSRPAPSVEVRGPAKRWQTRPGAGVSLFDFGAASVSLSIDVDESVDDLDQLAAALYEHPGLLSAARDVAADLLATLGRSAAAPEVLAPVEDYAVYELSPIDDEGSGPLLVERAGPALARVLRAESAALSADEIGEAISTRLSYGPGDVALVDWNAALLISAPAGQNRPGQVRSDEFAVLEYANVELLEMRVLDERLDSALDTAFAVAHRGRWWVEPADLGTVAKLQVEGALLFEAVNNAAKLVGDQYLARLYRGAARRFHLPDWDATILRKLETLESIYDKMNDRRTNRRMEILEWIIIVLIAAEIVMSLAPTRW
jgi:hypothetical protein